MSQGQRSDPVLSQVIDRLETNAGCPAPTGNWMKPPLRRYRQLWSELSMTDGILVRHRRPGPRQTSIPLIVVPSALVPSILEAVHDSPLGGHLGVDKTSTRILEKYYWAGYSTDVADFIQTCDVCQRRKTTVPSPRAALQPIPVGRPFEMLAMDFLELPQTPRGNRYVLVVADYFTRWIEAFAVPDQKRETVARTLIDGVFTRHGFPLLLHSDHGRNFEGNVIKEMCGILGIEKVRTSPYHPQCDGLVERMNRQIIDMLAKYCSKNPTSWDQWLQVVLGAYRTATHSSTGFSPAELVYGRQLRSPSDLLLQPVQDPAGYIEEIKTNHQLAKEIVEAEMAASQERQARNYNKGTVEPNVFQVGDHVYNANPTGRSRKICQRFTGPFRVLARKGDTNYLVRHIRGGRRQCIHRNRLKACYRRTHTGSDNDGNKDQGNQRAQPQTEIRAETVNHVPQADARQQTTQEQSHYDDESLLIRPETGEERQGDENEHPQPNLQLLDQAGQEQQRGETENHQPNLQVLDQAGQEQQCGGNGNHQPNLHVLDRTEGHTPEETQEEQESAERSRRNVRQPVWLQDFETTFDDHDSPLEGE